MVSHSVEGVGSHRLSQQPSQQEFLDGFPLLLAAVLVPPRRATCVLAGWSGTEAKLEQVIMQIFSERCPSLCGSLSFLSPGLWRRGSSPPPRALCAPRRLRLHAHHRPRLSFLDSFQTPQPTEDKGTRTESLGPVVAGSVLAEFENTALCALRDFASSGGTAKEVWYGSSGPSSVHPAGLMGGYPQVCNNLRCARNVQARTQERSSCTRFNGVCPLEKKKASLSPRASISVEVLPVVVASSPASPVCGLWGCVPFCCCYQPFSRLRWWFEGRLLGEVGVVSRCTPRTKENTTEPVGLSRRSRYSRQCP